METKELRAKWNAEIQALLKQRVEIDNRIMGFQTMIRGLDYIEKGQSPNWKGPVPLPPGMENLHSAGLTDAVRLVLSHSDGPLLPRQIRDRLVMYSYDQLPKVNPMAAIHGVLRRLVDTGEIEAKKVDSSKTAYRILSAVERAVSTTLKALSR
jgi:hypothetical protein